MPELPEVETVARTLRPRLVGRTIAGVETSGLALRAPLDGVGLSAACTGARVAAVDRIGKYLLVRLSHAASPRTATPAARIATPAARPATAASRRAPAPDGDHVLVVHLGMSGSLLVVPSGAPRAPHTHAVFHLDRRADLRYVDPRRFGIVVPYPAAHLAAAPELAALGPDPLSPAFTPAYLAAELASSRRDIKQFLLDQARVAGLGNIYVSEALHRACISPRRAAWSLGAARARRLHDAIRAILSAAIDRRGTTFRSYVDADGERGDNQHHLAVYGREGEPCLTCRARIARLVQGARSTFYCPRCQR